MQTAFCKRTTYSDRLLDKVPRRLSEPIELQAIGVLDPEIVHGEWQHQ